MIRQGKIYFCPWFLQQFKRYGLKPIRQRAAGYKHRRRYESWRKRNPK